MDGDLLTCPFCGSDDLSVYKGHGGDKVQCFGCGVSGVHVRIWNRRCQPAEQTSPKPAADAGQIRRKE